MKKLLLLFLLCPLSAVCQTIEPSKGDAIISIQSEKSLLQISALLMEHNYTVDKLDTVLNFVTTQPRNIPTINGEYYLQISGTSGEYKVKGMMRFNFTASLAGISSAKGAYDIAKYTKSQSPSKRVFSAAWQAANGIGTVTGLSKP